LDEFDSSGNYGTKKINSLLCKVFEGSVKTHLLYVLKRGPSLKKKSYISCLLIFVLVQNRKPQRCSGHGDSNMSLKKNVTIVTFVTVSFKSLTKPTTHHLQVKNGSECGEKFVVRSYTHCHSSYIPPFKMGENVVMWWWAYSSHHV